ncbi:MAG: DNA primase [Candidatus Omnitrophica bacterium]|nr:DNA primase [Candidatus Omnitrophota bacterium]
MADVDRVKQQILDQADIVEVIGKYVRLQNRSGRFVGLCPFHKEKTPSFSVNAERGFFHCFGCGKGGNVIDFVMGVENLTYGEARRHLAAQLGIRLDPPSGARRSRDEIDRYQLMDQAALFFVKRLQNNQNALNYLQSREVRPEHIQQFGLGFAPNEWDGLLVEFRKRKIPEKVLEELGLIIPRKDGSGYYDRFRNRIMFPIRNTLGRVIAFGGRSLDPNDHAKYLNSNDTPLFNKSKVLYLLDKAKDVLKERGAVLVEGYMDAISLHMRGFQQTVASLGTSLTLDHIQILRRYTKNYTVLYDGDSAGIRAAMRSVELFLESGHTVRAALLPEGMDPDDYIKQYGAEAMQKFLDDSMDGFEFYAEQSSIHHDAKTMQGKLEIVESVMPLFARIQDPMLKKDCIARLAKHLDNQEISVVESTIAQKLKTGKYQTYSAPQDEKQSAPTLKKNDPYAHLKEPLIRLLALQKGLLSVENVSSKQASTLFSTQQISEMKELMPLVNENSRLDALISRLMEFTGENPQGGQAARLAEFFPANDDAAPFLSVTESEPLPNNADDLQKLWRDLAGALKTIQEKQRRRSIMKQAEADPQKALEAFNKILLTERESAN